MTDDARRHQASPADEGSPIANSAKSSVFPDKPSQLAVARREYRIGRWKSAILSGERRQMPNPTGFRDRGERARSRNRCGLRDQGVQVHSEEEDRPEQDRRHAFNDVAEHVPRDQVTVGARDHEPDDQIHNPDKANSTSAHERLPILRIVTTPPAVGGSEIIVSPGVFG